MSPNTSSPAVVGQDTSRPSLPDVLPLPAGKTTLVGGTIRSVDHVRDRLILDVFGGGYIAILFDERTRVFRGEKGASPDSLENGERASVDTTLDGKNVFARNIRVASAASAGQGDGQIVGFEPRSGILTLRESLTPELVKMRLASGATILRGGHAAEPSELQPGMLVTLSFQPGKEGQAVVREVSILASPGATFAFAGLVEYVDLHRGFLTLVDPRDNKRYEVNFDPSKQELVRDVREGEDISVEATFDGRRYEASTLTVNRTSDK